MSDSLWPHGLQPARLLCPWNSPGKNTGVGCHSLLQGIFPTQGSSSRLLHCRQILYLLSHQGGMWKKKTRLTGRVRAPTDRTGLTGVLSLPAGREVWMWQIVGGQSEVLRPWQRSWGRRLDIRKGGIEPQESPWKSSSIYPHNQSLPTLLLCALTYPSDFTGGCPPPPLSEKELT